MRKLWLLLMTATSLTAFGPMAFGSAPTASADEWCLHGIYIDPTDLKAYACPWGGGIVHTAHGEVLVNPGGLVVPDSAYAYGLPDDGRDDADNSDDDSGD